MTSRARLGTRLGAQRNMLVMALCFSVGEACLTSVIILNGASLDGDASIAALSNSSLYLGFVVATLVAPAVLEWLGSDRLGIAYGLLGVSLYAVARLASLSVLHLLGATAAGMSGALLWTAEGSFLSKMVAVDAACDPPRSPSVSAARLSGIFAAILPCALTVAKLFASAVLLPLGDSRETLRILFLSYAVLGMLASTALWAFLADAEDTGLSPNAATPVPFSSAAGMLAASDRQQPPTLSRACARTWSRTRATLARNLTLEMALLIPNNVAFGLATGNMPMYGSRIVVRALGSGHIGWLFALSGMLSAAVAAANGSLSSARARALSTCTGALAFALTGLLSAWLARRLRLDQPPPAPQSAAADSARALVPVVILLFLMYGYGMAVWQGTTMAVFAERFADDPPVGFANLKLHSGLASAFAFYAFHRLGAVAAGNTCAVWALLGSLCFLLLRPTRPRAAALSTEGPEYVKQGADVAHTSSRTPAEAGARHLAIELGAVSASSVGAESQPAVAAEPAHPPAVVDSSACASPAQEETGAAMCATEPGADDDQADEGGATPQVGWIAHKMNRRKHMDQILT